MKLRNLRVLRKTKRPDRQESWSGASRDDESKSIREELQKCQSLMKQQRFVIAKYEMVLRRQRRLVSISYAVALVLLAVVALAVSARWFGWQNFEWLLP